MTKQSILAISVLAVFVACNKPKSTTISGELKESNGEVLILEELNAAGQKILDSAKLDAKGQFEFKTPIPHIGFYRIRIGMENFGMLVLDSLQGARITGSAKDLGKTYKVEGSEETDAFIAFQSVSKLGQEKMDSLQGKFQAVMTMLNNDSTKFDSVNAVFQGGYNSLLDQISLQMATAIKNHNSSYASLAFLPMLNPEKNEALFKDLSGNLAKKYPKSKEVVSFNQQVSDMYKLAVGSMAPEISQLSPDGKTQNLSSLKGKVVLIDFWASWCKPCLKESPNVVKLYNKFKSKGLEILGVSLDKEKANWEVAIADYQLAWLHVIDANGKAAADYGVKAIPFTILIDKEGKIIAKGLHAEELDEKLTSLIGS
jgi:peroxiredoxin